MSTGSYYIPVERLALGGMAEIFLALQKGMGGFERLVVLKRVLAHLREDPAFSRMFLDEARLASYLRHPNVVDVLDVQRDEDSFFIVMEYLSGVDLRTVIARIKENQAEVPARISARIIADAAAGLHHLHEATDRDGEPLKMVHRDVAPGNILVTFDGVTKLLDFGVAKAAIVTSYTEPGQIRGKYSYCSPEQVLQADLDARSDLFSLGVVFYELLTGLSLFGVGGPAAILSAVLNSPIARPRNVNPSVPDEIDDIVMCALERDPSNRFSTTGELAEVLEDWLSSQDVPTSQLHVSRWLRMIAADELDHKRELERTALDKANAVDFAAQSPSLTIADGYNEEADDSFKQSSFRTSSATPSAVHSNEPSGLYALLSVVLGVGLTLLAIVALAAAYLAGRSSG